MRFFPPEMQGWFHIFKWSVYWLHKHNRRDNSYESHDLNQCRIKPLTEFHTYSYFKQKSFNQLWREWSSLHIPQFDTLSTKEPQITWSQNLSSSSHVCILKVWSESMKRDVMSGLQKPSCNHEATFVQLRSQNYTWGTRKRGLPRSITASLNH